MFSAEQLLQIRHIIAEETTEALNRQRNQRTLVFYGLPEGDQHHQVNSILAKADISPEYICIRNRLGNPTLGKNRPLRVDLRKGIPMPSLRDLARKLTTDATTRIFHVRLLETPRQRKEGFAARQARRQHPDPVPVAASAAPATAQVLEFSPVRSVDIYFPPVVTLSSFDNSIVDIPPVITISSSSNSLVDTTSPECQCFPGRHPVDSAEKFAFHIETCIHVAKLKFDYFCGIVPLNLQSAVSRLYFSSTGTSVPYYYDKDR